MKGRVVALDHVRGRPAAALIEDGRVEDLVLPPKDEGRTLPGAIFRAIADRPMKGQGGGIVSLPGGATGFLRAQRPVRTGTKLLVQVTGVAEPGKAVPVTDRILFKSRFAIVTPDAPGQNVSRRIRDPGLREALTALAETAMAGCAAGLILRSAAAEADPDAVAADIAATRALAEAVLSDAAGDTPELLVDAPDAHLLAWRDWPVPDLTEERAGAFADHAVLEAIEAFAAPAVSLTGGATAFIEPTRALVAIDVNTGADTSPAAGLKANLALARALPRELRCRGLGGQITVDPAPMPKANRKAWEQDLRAAFRRDSIETALAGWTPLGHYELRRKRERLPIAECLLP